MSSPVEQIKARLNIVDVVQGYLKLQKAGVNFKALCPFHHEKTPSFFVSPTRDTWHCFGCNRGGDLFSFVMEIESVEFPEALKILAAKAGIDLKPVSIQYKTERSRILELLEESKNFYEDELKKNKKVIDYLKERGLTDKTIKEFSLGFAPEGWRNLYSFLKTKGYTESEMEKSGMIIKHNNYYDRFRSRIMFPINGNTGQVLGFSGRIFSSPTYDVGGTDIVSQGKYINTPQTLVYNKSKILYGLDKAKEEIRKKDLCILVEGNTDVTMSHQAGIKNTVAVSGTALTQEHLQIIKRLTNNIAMAFDKDEAGFQASQRGVDLALREGFELKIISIPAGKDPADTIKKDKKIWEEAVAKAKHIIEFYLEALSESIEDKRILQKNIENMVLPYVTIIKSEIEKAHWVKEIAKILNIKEEPVWEELKKIKLEEKEALLEHRNEIQQIQKTKNRLTILRERVTGFAFWQAESEDLELKNFINESIKKHNINLEELEQEKDKLVLSAEIFYSGLEDVKKEFENLVRELEKENIKYQLEEIANRIRRLEASEDNGTLNQCLNHFYDLTKRLSELK